MKVQLFLSAFENRLTAGLV